MRALPIALVLLVLVTPLAVPRAPPSGVFASPVGVYLADIQLDDFCAGPATAVLELTTLDLSTTKSRVVTGDVSGFPSPCDWICVDDCTVPFDIVFEGHDGRTRLVGGGTAGNVLSYSLSGTWEEGVVEVQAATAYPSPCDPRLCEIS